MLTYHKLINNSSICYGAPGQDRLISLLIQLLGLFAVFAQKHLKNAFSANLSAITPAN